MTPSATAPVVSEASTVVFVGPSLSRTETEKALGEGVEIRPPVRRGDFETLGTQVDLVGVIDGVFFADQAISPREILEGLRRGIRIIGSSSMGALRAAELDRFGMDGVGAIYRMYATGELTSDADVALTFDPETGRALTEPIVNVIHMTKLASSAGALDAAAAAEVVGTARGIYFPELTYPHLLAALRAKLAPAELERLASFISTHLVEGDLKRADALAALDRIKRITRESLAD